MAHLTQNPNAVRDFRNRAFSFQWGLNLTGGDEECKSVTTTAIPGQRKTIQTEYLLLKSKTK